MKRNQIENCIICDKGIAHNGQIFFYELKIQQHGLDRVAIQQQAGLEMYFGGGPGATQLADVMGPNTDISKPIGDEIRTLICMDCACDNDLPIAVIEERIINRKDN